MNSTNRSILAAIDGSGFGLIPQQMFAAASKRSSRCLSLITNNRKISSIPSLYHLTEEEKMLKDAVSRFASEKVKPL
jgi:hypothetical protein